MVIGLDASRLDRQQRTGTENYAYQVTKGLLASASAGDFSLRLYGRGPLPADIFPAAAGPWQVRYLPCRHLWTHRCLRREVRRESPEVLFVPAHVLPLGAPADLPQVVTVHDLGYLHFPKAHPWRQRVYLRWSTRLSARQATRVIADSRATATDLVEREGIAPAKIEVIYPGVDRNLQPVGDPQQIEVVRRKYGIPEGPYLLYLGTLQPRKNILRLLDAWAQVVARRHDGGATLVLAGRRGWLLKDLSRRVEALELAGRVILPGYIAAEDVAPLFSGALVFVFPSLYEGFGLPALEAMAYKTPVLAANTSSLPEVAGDAALLVDPLSTAAIADGMRRLLQEPVLRRELVRRGEENLRRFSWEQSVEQIILLLKEVAA